MNKFLDDIKSFLSNRKKELKKEKRKLYEDYTNGAFEKPYEYWNEVYKIQGKFEMLKEISSFITFLNNMDKFGGYVSEEQFIPTDDDLIGRDHTQWNPEEEWNKI